MQLMVDDWIGINSAPQTLLTLIHSAMDPARMASWNGTGDFSSISILLLISSNMQSLLCNLCRGRLVHRHRQLSTLTRYKIPPRMPKLGLLVRKLMSERKCKGGRLVISFKASEGRLCLSISGCFDIAFVLLATP